MEEENKYLVDRKYHARKALEDILYMAGKLEAWEEITEEVLEKYEDFKYQLWCLDALYHQHYYEFPYLRLGDEQYEDFANYLDEIKKEIQEKEGFRI